MDQTNIENVFVPTQSGTHITENRTIAPNATSNSKQLRWDSDLKWVSATQYKLKDTIGTNVRLIEMDIQETILSSHDNFESSTAEWCTAAVYPSDGELGGLASLVYEKDGGNAILKALEQYDETKISTVPNGINQNLDTLKSLNVKGWKLIGMASHSSSRNSHNGYVGALYWQPVKRYFVLAHRGTKLASLGAIRADIEGIFGGSYVEQMNSAATFSHIVVEALKKWNDKNKFAMSVLSLTGHSLGGWLSQITTFTVKYLEYSASHFKIRETFQYHPHTVVWDSPGAKPMLLQLKQDSDLRHNSREEFSKLSISGLDIRSYLSAPNQINTCNSHTGVIYRLFPKFTISNDEESMLSCWKKNMESYLVKYTCFYTFKTHSLDTLLAAYPNDNDRGNSGKLQQVTDWPIKSSILGGIEYENFFKVTNQLNNYHIKDLKMLENDEMNEIQKRLVIRYRTEDVDTNNVDIRIFSHEEIKFLESVKTLQVWLVKERKPFSNIQLLHQFLREKKPNQGIVSKFVQIFTSFTLENTGRLLQARQMPVFQIICGIKQFVNSYPDVVEKMQKEIEKRPALRKIVHWSETNWLVGSLDFFFSKL